MLQEEDLNEPPHSPPITGGSWLFIYSFFLVHMLAFGSAGFFLAYGPDPDFGFNVIFSGFAICVYMVFYLVMFGLDEIKWLIINSALGVLGVISQLDWILERFGKSISDFPARIHVIPFIYYVLYTFLLRRAVLHIFKAQVGTRAALFIDIGYVVISLIVYLVLLNR